MTTAIRLIRKPRLSKTADCVSMTRIKDGLFAPVLGPLIQRRWVIVLPAALAFVQVALTAAGLSAWQCPLESALGVVGPGCGLTRAMVWLVKGHWQAAIELHAFAPLFLGLGIFLAVVGILPAMLRQKAANQITAFERRTGITAVIILSILIYWILRLIHLV